METLLIKAILILLTFIFSYSQDTFVLNNNRLIETEILEINESGLLTKANFINFKIIKEIRTSNLEALEKLKKIIPNLRSKNESHVYIINFLRKDLARIPLKDNSVIKEFAFAINSRTFDKYNPLELQLNSYSFFENKLNFQLAMSLSGLINDKKDHINSFSFGFGQSLELFNIMIKYNIKSNNYGEGGEFFSAEVNSRLYAYEKLNLLAGISYSISNLSIKNYENMFYLNIGIEYSLK